MDCKTAQSLIIPYINHQLNDDQTEEFLKHIFECRECFEELEIFYTVHVALQKLDEDGQVSYNMRELLWNDLKGEERRIRRRKLIHRFSYTVMTLAEILLLLMLFSHFGNWKPFERAATETETETLSETQTESETETESGKEAQTENGRTSETEEKTQAGGEAETQAHLQADAESETQPQAEKIIGHETEAAKGTGSNE